MNVQHTALNNKFCSLRRYAYLWVDDRKEFMRQFLLYNHVLTAEEIEAHAESGVPESPPTLEQFRSHIDSYEMLFNEVSDLPEHKVVRRLPLWVI